MDVPQTYAYTQLEAKRILEIGHEDQSFDTLPTADVTADGVNNVRRVWIADPQRQAQHVCTQFRHVKSANAMLSFYYSSDRRRWIYVSRKDLTAGGRVWWQHALVSIIIDLARVGLSRHLRRNRYS